MDDDYNILKKSQIIMYIRYWERRDNSPLRVTEFRGVADTYPSKVLGYGEQSESVIEIEFIWSNSTNGLLNIFSILI